MNKFDIKYRAHNRQKGGVSHVKIFLALSLALSSAAAILGGYAFWAHAHRRAK